MVNNAPYLRVQDEEDEVESGEQRVRQLQIFDDGFVFVPLRVDGISGRQNGSTGVERANDASFGDGQSLLLHHLVKHRSG